MDRLILGSHANNDLGFGMYASRPGINVSDPEVAISGNLMFDSSVPFSLDIIQTGNFKITCERVALDALRGDIDPVTGRPVGGRLVKNADDDYYYQYAADQQLGIEAENDRAKLANYLDTGMVTIPINEPLTDGEIPEIVLRFAVGNSSGHFHPWYANVTMDRSHSKDWDEFAYANSAEIVYMDSPWLRMKWGGIGNESYTGFQLNSNFADYFGYWDELKTQIDNSASGNPLDPTVYLSDSIAVALDVSLDSWYTEDSLRAFVEEQLGSDGFEGMFFGSTPPGLVGSPVTGYVWAQTPAVSYGERFWHPVRFYQPALIDTEADWYNNEILKAEAEEARIAIIETEMKKRSDARKVFSSGLGNIQGIVGLMHYANSTHFTVNAFMTPTHSGLRDYGHNAIDDYANWNFPVGQHPHTAELKSWYMDMNPGSGSLNYTMGDPVSGSSGTYNGLSYTRQLMTSAKAIQWAGALWRHGTTNDKFLSQNEKYWYDGAPDRWDETMTSTRIRYDSAPGSAETEVAYLPRFSSFPEAVFSQVAFEHLPMVSNYQGYGNYRHESAGSSTKVNDIAPGYDQLHRDYANKDLYGWKGHPTQFFVNPFSNSTCTFSTHMLPPYYLSDVDSVGNEDSLFMDFLTGKPAGKYGGWYGRFANMAFESVGFANTGEKYEMEHAAGIGMPWRAWDWENEQPIGGWGNTVWGPTSGITTAAENLAKKNEPVWFSNTGGPGGVIWPAGHEFADGDDYREWTGSMGLGGAGSKTSLRTDDCWDTFYCSYVVYSHGAKPDTQPAATPQTTRAPSSPGESSSAMWSGYWNGTLADDDTPSLINNFVFPDDIVRTVGNTVIDPFAGHRDSAGKILGNLHFTLELEAGKYYGSDLFSRTTRKPLPAITLDFSSSKWNFDNNKTVTLSIINSAQIIGGGGAGGHGTRRYAVPATGKIGSVATGGHGGGGGGAGAGTGRNPSTANADIDLGYTGTGWYGRGWGQDRLVGNPNILGQHGTNGTKFTGSGSGGARALQLSTINDGDVVRSINMEVYARGGDGGDAIGIIHPEGIEPVIDITNLGAGVIAGGGGGGAGGYELDGGDGGALGSHGEAIVGEKTFTGGNPGYVVGSGDSSYSKSIKISNFSTGNVHGRNPDISAYDTSNTSGGVAGGWVLTGNTSAYYKAMATVPITTLSANTILLEDILEED